MSSNNANSLHILQRAEILRRLQINQDIEPFLADLLPGQMRDLRNFLIQEIQHLSQIAGEPVPAEEEIKSHFETATNYYYKQDCKEPLESCFNETCLEANPTCFSKKMRTQIKVLTNLILPKIGKSENE